MLQVNAKLHIEVDAMFGNESPESQGLDAVASYDLFEQMLEDRVRRAYPGADVVNITVMDAPGRDEYRFGPDTDDIDDGAVAEEIYRISNALWEEFTWMVEATS